jgi:hypothetical protein
MLLESPSVELPTTPIGRSRSIRERFDKLRKNSIRRETGDLSLCKARKSTATLVVHRLRRPAKGRKLSLLTNPPTCELANSAQRRLTRCIWIKTPCCQLPLIASSADKSGLVSWQPRRRAFHRNRLNLRDFRSPFNLYRFTENYPSMTHNRISQPNVAKLTTIH